MDDGYSADRSCSICGSPILSVSTRPTEKLKWTQELRAVQFSPYDNHSKLTGVGYYFDPVQAFYPYNQLRSETYAPQDALQSYLSPDAELQPYPDQLDIIYIFHEACWEILCERISSNFYGIDSVAAALSVALYCIPCNDLLSPHPGHDHGSSARVWLTSAEQPSQLRSMRDTYSEKEPSRFNSVEEILSCCSKNMSGAALISQEKALYFKNVHSFDIFSRLPVEVTHILLSWLRSDDVSRLRLASKFIAVLSSVKMLPQFFWKSRFSFDFEMGFARPHYTGSHTDWRGLYFIVKNELVASGSGRLKNRKGIMQMVNKNADLLELYMRGMQLHGVSIAWDDTPEPDSADGSIPENLSGRVIKTEVRNKGGGIVYYGSRESFTRHLSLRSKPQKVCSVGVSTVLFNSRTYISGLRFCLENDGTSKEITSKCLGRVIPTEEQVLQLSSEQRFAGFELATCVNGITGISLIVKTGLHKLSSTWVGDVGQGDLDIAFGNLPVEDDQCFLNFAASFDDFKMISLAMIESKTFDATDYYSTVAKNLDIQNLTPQPLWTPRPPDNTTLIPRPVDLASQSFNAILNMDFGGNKGENLDKLTRIVAHTGIYRRFVGLMFDLDGHNALLFGKQGLTELSFLIDGARGERVSAVTYEQGMFPTGIRSLEIHTNFGRSGTFQLDKEYAATTYYQQPFNKRTLTAPEGQTITGLTSILDFRMGGFQTLGLQCVSAPKPEVFDQSPTENAGISAAEICKSMGAPAIEHSESVGNSYTYASLDNVRRIRFSHGATNRPREQGELSGLRLDYFDSQPSQIIGQWLVETDSMDLERGERVVEVCIKTSSLQFTRGTVNLPLPEGYAIGRTVGMSILTSRMQLKTIEAKTLPFQPACREFNFRENRLEKLSVIAWAFDFMYDHPRVSKSSATTESNEIQLWDPTGFPNDLSAIVPEMVLWQDTDHNGQPDWVVGVSANQEFTYTVKYITGLIFTYKSGATRSIGRTNGEVTKQLVFDYENLSHLEMARSNRGLLEVAFGFRTTDGEPPRTDFRRLTASSREIPDVDAVILNDHINLSSQHKSEYLSGTQCVGGTSSYGHTSFNKMPEKEVIGLWGISSLSLLGIVYSDKPRPNATTAS